MTRNSFITSKWYRCVIITIIVDNWILTVQDTGAAVDRQKSFPRLPRRGIPIDRAMNRPIAPGYYDTERSIVGSWSIHCAGPNSLYKRNGKMIRNMTIKTPHQY